MIAIKVFASGGVVYSTTNAASRVLTEGLQIAPLRARRAYRNLLYILEDILPQGEARTLLGGAPFGVSLAPRGRDNRKRRFR